MPDTLNPCPFCGGEAEVNYSCLYETGYFVSCTMCEARTKKYSSREKAEKAWNRRVGCEPAGEHTASNRPKDGSWRVGEGEKG